MYTRQIQNFILFPDKNTTKRIYFYKHHYDQKHLGFNITTVSTMCNVAVKFSSLSESLSRPQHNHVRIYPNFKILCGEENDTATAEFQVSTRGKFNITVGQQKTDIE